MMSKKVLVAKSQDKHVFNTRLCNLGDEGKDLYLLLTDLCNDLKPPQRIKLGKIIEIGMRSALRRSTNSTELVTTDTPTDISLMHKTCLTRKQSIMRNIPAPRC